jgi:hypothetical protein
MTRNGTSPTHGDPSATVLAAYRAANSGRYAQADGYLAPGVVRALERAGAGVQAAARRIDGLLVRLNGDQDAASCRSRGTLLALKSTLGALAATRLGSPRHRRKLWNTATRGRALAAIEVTRQRVDGRWAVVHLRLTLSDGSIEREAEPLVLHRGRWLLG